jgi:hypothetical protein
LKKNYDLEKYKILCDKKYGELKWFLLILKNQYSNNIINYDNLIWVPKINIADIDKFNDYQSNEEKDKDKYEENNLKSSKNNNIINKGKDISFSSNVNSFSFHNTEEINKNKNNNINNQNSKFDSIFTLGNNYNNNNEDNNDNKLLEKLKVVLEKLSKMEDRYLKLQKKYMKLKERIKKHNKNNTNIIKITISDDSNDMSNGNDIGIIDNNFDGENDALSKLNMNKNLRGQQEYFESISIELEATKNQLVMIKKEFKELEKKFETMKQISENLFSKLTLKKKEKEEFAILLKVMDFTDEKISIILDKKKLK